MVVQQQQQQQPAAGSSGGSSGRSKAHKFKSWLKGVGSGRDHSMSPSTHAQVCEIGLAISLCCCCDRTQMKCMCFACCVEAYIFVSCPFPDPALW
jgi:hypothetical protein